jgi:hypothetical protein
MHSGLKKLLIASALCACVAYCVDRINETEKADLSRKEAEKVQFEQNKAAIRALTEKYSASHDWYRLFDRPRVPFGRPVMQADLENAWLIKQPIIFLGQIDDYKNAESDRYQVTIKPDIFSFVPFVSGVALDVSASRGLIDKFVKQHPEVLSPYLSPKGGIVVVIAKVNSIETRWEGGGEDAEEVRYGIGELIDLRIIRGRIPVGKGADLFYFGGIDIDQVQ